MQPLLCEVFTCPQIPPVKLDRSKELRDIIHGKRVVVIGKAGELIRNDYATLVGECDVVVRVNPFVKNGKIELDPTVSKHTTTRTDIVYHNSCKVGEVLVGGIPTQENLGMGPTLAASYAASGVRAVVRVDDAGHDSVYREFNKKVSTFRSKRVIRRNVFNVLGQNMTGLTTGTKAIVDILDYEPASLHIIGMDATNDYGPEPEEYRAWRLKNEKRCANDPACKVETHKPQNDMKVLLETYKTHPGIVHPSEHLKRVWESFDLS